MLNKLLTIPFFLFIICMPLGITLVASYLGLFKIYGDWCFAQWDKREPPEETLDIDEREF